MEKVQIKIPSIMENVRIVESFIDNIKDNYSINDDIYGNIMVTVTESVNNAIQHGNKFDKDKNVTISMELLSDRIKFSIEDEGPGFDYTLIKDPTAPENLDKVSGRGIYVMKMLADEVEFKNEGKIVEVSFNIKKK